MSSCCCGWLKSLKDQARKPERKLSTLLLRLREFRRSGMQFPYFKCLNVLLLIFLLDCGGADKRDERTGLAGSVSTSDSKVFAYNVPLKLSLAGAQLTDPGLTINNISGYFICPSTGQKIPFSESRIQSNCNPNGADWMITSFTDGLGATVTLTTVAPNSGATLALSDGVQLTFSDGIRVILGAIGSSAATATFSKAATPPATTTNTTTPSGNQYDDTHVDTAKLAKIDDSVPPKADFTSDTNIQGVKTTFSTPGGNVSCGDTKKWADLLTAKQRNALNYALGFLDAQAGNASTNLPDLVNAATAFKCGFAPSQAAQANECKAYVKQDADQDIPIPNPMSVLNLKAKMLLQLLIVAERYSSAAQEVIKAGVQPEAYDDAGKPVGNKKVTVLPLKASDVPPEWGPKLPPGWELLLSDWNDKATGELSGLLDLDLGMGSCNPLLSPDDSCVDNVVTPIPQGVTDATYEAAKKAMKPFVKVAGKIYGDDWMKGPEYMFSAWPDILAEAISQGLKQMMEKKGRGVDKMGGGKLAGLRVGTKFFVMALGVSLYLEMVADGADSWVAMETNWINRWLYEVLYLDNDNNVANDVYGVVWGFRNPFYGFGSGRYGEFWIIGAGRNLLTVASPVEPPPLVRLTGCTNAFCAGEGLSYVFRQVDGAAYSLDDTRAYAAWLQTNQQLLRTNIDEIRLQSLFRGRPDPLTWDFTAGSERYQQSRNVFGSLDEVLSKVTVAAGDMGDLAVGLRAYMQNACVPINYCGTGQSSNSKQCDGGANCIAAGQPNECTCKPGYSPDPFAPTTNPGCVPICPDSTVAAQFPSTGLVTCIDKCGTGTYQAAPTQCPLSNPTGWLVLSDPLPDNTSKYGFRCCKSTETCGPGDTCIAATTTTSPTSCAAQFDPATQCDGSDGALVCDPSTCKCRQGLKPDGNGTCTPDCRPGLIVKGLECMCRGPGSAAAGDPGDNLQPVNADGLCTGLGDTSDGCYIAPINVYNMDGSTASHPFGICQRVLPATGPGVCQYNCEPTDESFQVLNQPTFNIEWINGLPQPPQ